jgi:nuclear pore complex protein Nup107
MPPSFSYLPGADVAFGQHLPLLRGPLPSIIALQPPPTDAEAFLLRSIEWTTFSFATYDTALEQANVILRYFLGWVPFTFLLCCLLNRHVTGAGRVHLALTLLGMLPPELATIGDPEERATEYLHYRQFFTIWETLEQVVECQAKEVPGMGREAKAGWLEDYRVSIHAVM